MVFMKTSHGTLKYHIRCSLEYKEGRLELVFEDNYCQLYKFLPTTTLSKVQVHYTRLEIESALKNKMSHVNVTFYEYHVYIESELTYSSIESW